MNAAMWVVASLGMALFVVIAGLECYGLYRWIRNIRR